MRELALSILIRSEDRMLPATRRVGRVRRPRGRPQQRPICLVADRGYDSMPLRRALRQRNIQPIIPRGCVLGPHTASLHRPGNLSLHPHLYE